MQIKLINYEKEKFINYLEYRANSAVNKAEQCNA